MAEGASGLSQAEIDAKNKRMAEGSWKERKPVNWSTVDYGPENLRFDPRAGGTNIYDDRYRQALATFERGTPLQQEEILGRMQLGQRAGQAHRAMRGSGPLGAAAGMRPLVQQQLGTASRMGQARGQREMAQKAALGRSIQHAGQVDTAKAASESARMQAISAFKRGAKGDADAAARQQASMWLMLAGRGAGAAEDWYNQEPMQTYDV